KETFKDVKESNKPKDISKDVKEIVKDVKEYDKLTETQKSKLRHVLGIHRNHVAGLGNHVVGSGEQRPEQKKVEKVLKLKPPRTKREVKSLLGFLNYYRKFVPNFSELSTPLSDLTKKGKPDKVTWTEECEDALKKIQDVFSSEPVLKLPDLNKPFLVRTDASSHGIGAVLMQEHDGYIMPCLYASRKLLPREQNYAVIEKECLAIIFGVSTFSRYLLLSEFIIETDHKPLAYLKVSKAKNSRLMRWSLILQQYCFHIRPISGGINHQADVLSRLV
ncbi:MAG: Ty3/Gypsy family RNase HI domain-containing protein, partial [Candidatus Omnitrophica bacterium]|nr:Ty3/Gypsy family RNase HI domain-containing protein [Candidatus Omnitrophota bacterium]